MTQDVTTLIAHLTMRDGPHVAQRSTLCSTGTSVDSPAVDFGIGYFPTHDGVSPGALARLVEERGHESLFFPEHTHIPASRATPYPAGGELPRKYFHAYDLFVALTAAAAATSKLRVGSGICLVIERDPIITAKEVASVDHLSGGRLEFGVGAGRARELWARADRPVEVIVAGVPAKPAVLEQLQKAGVRRVVRWIPSAALGPVERALERWEDAIAELHGE
jgi:alkanesulfonate monooxygenase SsuD/methylene tetrahydromethanopterin reductase-like flavin-dependent oxidoreductase (luciferase family)